MDELGTQAAQGVRWYSTTPPNRLKKVHLKRTKE